jgi:erythromycin esterase-like protein
MAELRRAPLLALLAALAACAEAPSPAQAVSEAPAVRAPAATAPVAAAPVAAAVRPITGDPDDYDEVLEAIGDQRRILLGESTHGTHEYYRERARLTERLVRERGVRAVAIEGDWGSTERVNRYVRGVGHDRSAAEALGGFRSFPEWMWANADFRDFVERLRAFNLARPAEERVGLYGMDVYDLFDAADAVVAGLRAADPAAAQRAQREYRCFAHYRRSTHAYGEAARRPRASCRDEAQAVLAQVRGVPRPADPAAAEAHFALVRNAASVAAAEEYFRTVYAGSMAWNVRDTRMAENVEEIAAHVEALSGAPAKVVIWCHNTHSGDARATFAANRGELSLGQLMRQRHGEDSFLIGFLSHSGTVYAAPQWDLPGRRYDMRPAIERSYSDLFHRLGIPAFSLVIRGNQAVAEALSGPLLERAIGVVYAPATERQSHYFPTRLAQQFDAIVYFDRTSAVAPLR